MKNSSSVPIVPPSSSNALVIAGSIIILLVAWLIVLFYLMTRPFVPFKRHKFAIPFEDAFDLAFAFSESETG